MRECTEGEPDQPPAFHCALLPQLCNLEEAQLLEGGDAQGGVAVEQRPGLKEQLVQLDDPHLHRLHVPHLPPAQAAPLLL